MTVSATHLRRFGCVFVFGVLACLARQASAATYYVDNQNPTATDSGPGTLATPYRTISAAVAQRGAAGNTIAVQSGNYPEQVTVGASGASGNPITIQAFGSVVVDGADDFSATSRWALVAGDVWLAAGVSWTPLQVFSDGARLSGSTATPAQLPARTFRHVAGVGLYVNAGGGNPGTHGVRVGRRSYGFMISGRTWVTVSGFTVTRAEGDAIHLTNASQCVISNNVVTFAHGHGIDVSGGSAVTLAGNRVSDHLDHGIYLSGGVTGSVVRDNASFRNARPEVRAARGIHLIGCSGNRLERNRVYENQDSGFQINTDSNNNVCVQNLSWNNGDHGYDHLGSSGTIHIGDVAYGNYNDGFSIEGTAPGVQLYNCIATNNGVGTGHYNLWVDSSSSSGFTSDYNIFWNATSAAPIKYISTIYSSVASFTAATGRDVHSTQADPRFVQAAAGDFRLLAGSPAIDAATSAPAQWPPTDFSGGVRVDVTDVPNTGAGSVTFADRGAFEFVPGIGGTAPVPGLTVTPSSGTAPLLVTADASSSRDDGAIVSYRFEFGDGAVVGPQISPIATHSYAAGVWTLLLTVIDDDGLSANLTRNVAVSGAPDQPPAVSAPATASVDENALLTVSVTAIDPDGNSIAALTADLSGLPAGHNATFVAPAGNTTGTFSWTPGYTHAGTYSVTFRAANALVGTATTAITVNNVDRAPIVVAPGNVKVQRGAQVTFGITASDPDGQPIGALTADLSRLPSGHNATFTPNATNTAGTFTWGTTTADKGTRTVTFTASNARSGSASTMVQVRNNAAVASQPGFDEDFEVLPDLLALVAVHPNPVLNGVSFVVDLPHPARVECEIYDLQGRTVWVESLELAAGRRTLRWDGTETRGSRSGAGVYLARVRTGTATWVRRIVRL